MNLCYSCLYSCGDVRKAFVCEKYVYVDNSFVQIYVKKRDDIKK